MNIQVSLQVFYRYYRYPGEFVLPPEDRLYRRGNAVNTLKLLLEKLKNNELPYNEIYLEIEGIKDRIATITQFYINEKNISLMIDIVFKKMRKNGKYIVKKLLDTLSIYFLIVINTDILC